MKTLKLLTSVFMSLLLTICVFSQVVIADSGCTFYIENQTISSGDTFEVAIKVKNNPGFNVLTLTLKYDEEKFDLIGEPENKIPEFSMIVAKNLLWTHSKNFSQDGTICLLKFRAKDGVAEGNYKFELVIREVINESTQSVSAVSESATITITCPHTNKTLTPAEDSNCIKQGNNAYYTCTDCGAILKDDGKTETTIEAEKRPIGEHTFVKHDKVEPDHKNSGMAEYYTCSVCSKIFDSAKKEASSTEGFEIPPIPHTFGDEWKFDETNHWHECECGEKTTPEAHTFNWTVVKEATEKTEGLEKGVCSVCGYETSRVIPPLVCEHTIEKVDAKAATCAAEGNIAHYICTKCHKNFSDEAGENEIEKEKVTTPKDPANHTGETKVVGELPPKCGDYGYTGDTVCAGCEAVIEKGKEIEPTGEHKNTEVRNAKDADCTNKGYTGDTYCLDCNQKINTGEETPIDPTKHNFKWQIDVEPTFDKPGLKHEECTRCGEKQNENTEIPPLDCFHSTMEHHEKVVATCINTGTVEYWHCAECNRDYSDEKGTLKVEKAEDLVLPIDPNNHVHTEIRNARPATCVSTGNSGDTYCTDCGILVTAGTVTSVDPNAHNYVNNVCTYCGNVRVVYRPTTYMYIDDYSHLASGIKERHVPDSMTMHTDGEYEWHYCMYCQHEYGKVRVVDVDDTIDIAVDDPVQSGDDELIPDVPVTEPEVSEPVQDTNPPTGIAIALLPMALAAGAVAIIRKK